MGVDIYGRNPQINSEKPELVPESASEQEKAEYFQALDKWDVDNPGYYFRANWWSWRPIHVIANLAIKVADLPLHTDGWGENGGDGLNTQEDCNLLADAMELFITLNKKEMKEDDDRMYICLGSWVTQEGKFISQEEEDKLNDAHPEGTIMYSSVVDENGRLVQSAHSSSLSHIKEFITFLRNCGGFQIF